MSIRTSRRERIRLFQRAHNVAVDKPVEFVLLPVDRIVMVVNVL